MNNLTTLAFAAEVMTLWITFASTRMGLLYNIEFGLYLLGKSIRWLNSVHRAQQDRMQRYVPLGSYYSTDSEELDFTVWVARCVVQKVFCCLQC